MAAPPARTQTTLASALLALDDLPPGWSVDSRGQSDVGSPTRSVTSPTCRDFVALGNASASPGSRAGATTSFSAGQDGPFIDEGIDALGSCAEVAALLARVAAADTSCHSVPMSLPGTGRSTFSVAPVSPARVGEHPVAVRITAQGGDLDRLELTQVVTGVDDTVIGLTLVGAIPDNVASSAQAAVEKAVTTLGTTAAGV